MARTPFLVIPLCCSWPLLQIESIGQARAQDASAHDHLTEVACVDVPPGEKRPEFGCFNVGTVTGLHFVSIRLLAPAHISNRKASEAAKSASGIVVEEDGRVWLSEFGDRNSAPRGGESIAVIGPCNSPQPRATQQFSPTLSCGPKTVPEFIHTLDPKVGM